MQAASLPLCSSALSATKHQQDHKSCVAEAEGSSAEQSADTESGEDSSAATQSSEASTAGETKAESAEDMKQLQLQSQHAQLPLQVQELSGPQHAQHTQQAQHEALPQKVQELVQPQHAQHTQQLQLSQLPQQVQELRQPQHAQHTPQAQHAQEVWESQQTQHAQQRWEAQQAQQGEKVDGSATDHQSTSELGATLCPAEGAEAHVTTSTHSKQSCLSGLTLFKFGKKKKSSICSAASGSQGAASSAEAGEAAAAAAGGGSLPHEPSQSSGRRVLKSSVKKVTPSCMRAANTGTRSHQHQGLQQQGLSSRGLSNLEVNNTMMNSSSSSSKVQLDAAFIGASTATGKQQPLPGAVDRNQRFSNLKGIFRRKQPSGHVREQAVSESVKGYGTASQGEAAADGDFIAAVRAPAGAALQAEVSGHSTTAGGKSADQVSGSTT